jgi:hypothetical protein
LWLTPAVFGLGGSDSRLQLVRRCITVRLFAAVQAKKPCLSSSNAWRGYETMKGMNRMVRNVCVGREERSDHKIVRGKLAHRIACPSYRMPIVSHAHRIHAHRIACPSYRMPIVSHAHRIACPSYRMPIHFGNGGANHRAFAFLSVVSIQL